MTKTQKFSINKMILFIIIFIIVLIIVIWGGVTDWKFIPDNTTPAPPTPAPPTPTPPTPAPPTPAPPTPAPPTPTPPTPTQKCSYKLNLKIAQVPSIPNTYGYMSKKDFGKLSLGSLSPNCFLNQITSENIPVSSILFTKGIRVPKYPDSKGPFLTINFPVIDINAYPTSAFYENCVNNKHSCNIKINIKYGSDSYGKDYLFDPSKGGTDAFAYWWLWPDSDDLSQLLNATITLDLIQIPAE